MILDNFGGKIIGAKEYGPADGNPHDTRNEANENTFDAVLLVNAVQYAINAFSFFAQPRCQHDPCFHHIQRGR